MATKTTKYGYINIPFTFMVRDKKYLKKDEEPAFTSKLSASNLLAVSAVRSLSSPEREVCGFRKRKNHVKLTQSSFSNRYNVSASTSRRALASLETCDKIEKTEEGMYFEGNKMGTRYLSVDEWLFFATFGEQNEYLTKSEVLVLSYIISFVKTKGYMKKSFRRIAGELGLSHTFVMNAVEKLDRLGIISASIAYNNREKKKTYILLEREYLNEKKAETLRRLYPTEAKRKEYYKNLVKMKKDLLLILTTDSLLHLCRVFYCYRF